MIIIGEKLNSSIPKTLEAMNSGDIACLQDLIQKQIAGGARYIDINTALCQDGELDMMKRIIDLVQEKSDCGIMLDSPNPEVIVQAIEKVSAPVIINSVTVDQRFDQLVPLAKEKGCGVVGLPVTNEGMPHDLATKIKNIDLLVDKLRQNGIADQNIYVDILVETLATNGGGAKEVLAAIAHITKNYPQVHSTGGLSNLSFGLPKRGAINAAFMSAAVCMGLGSAITDPTDQNLMLTLAAANAVAGRDEYCMDYITHVRENM